MAEIINIKVSVSGANVAITELQKIRTQVDYLNKTPVKITVDTAGMEEAVKLSTEHLKAQAKLIKEQLKAAESARKEAAEQAKVAKAVSVRAEAEEKAAQAIAKTAAETKKATAAHGDLVQRFLSLRQNEEQARQEAERLYQTFQQFARVSRLHGLTEQFLALESSESRARMEAERLYDVYRRLFSAIAIYSGSGMGRYTSGSLAGNTTSAGSRYGYGGEFQPTSMVNAGDVYSYYTTPRLERGYDFDWEPSEANTIADSIDDVAGAAGNASKSFGLMREGMSAAWAKMHEGNKLAEIMRDSLGNIVVKMAAWQIMGNIVGTVIRSLREGVATLKEVDQELINIQKVSDLTASQIKKIGDSAYETASKYGVSAKEYLEAVYTFQKAGIGENSEKMAELATKTMLVGDTTAEVATRFLIAANAAWKFGGDVEALSKLVDEADYINNNYATTLSDIATGLPIVGATAAQVGMTAEETMAAIGTIVASTGQTASKAATALRAIIMNLLGQTGELEDGTKVTQETIDSLNAVLNKYAAESLKASEESGKLINPLEAIAALAKAAEDPLVTETELFNILAGLGGKLRTTQLAALVNNLDMANSMLDGMADSAGTADREISIMLESWNAKTQNLKNTVGQFISHLVDSNGVKNMIDMLTSLVKILDGGLGKIMVIVGILYGATKAVLGLNAALATTIVTQNLGAKAVAGMTAAEIMQYAATLSLADAFKFLTAAMLKSPLFWAVAATATIYAIYKAIDLLVVTTEEYLDRVQESIDKVKEYDSQLKENNAKIEENTRLIEEANEAGRNDAYILRLQNENALLEAQNKLLEANAADERKRAHNNAVKGLSANTYQIKTGEETVYDPHGNYTVPVYSNVNILQYINDLLKRGNSGENVIGDLNEAIETLTVFRSALDTTTEEGQRYAQAIGRATVYVEAYADSLNRAISENKDATTAQQEATDAAQTAVAIYTAMKEKLDPLNQAMAEMSKQGYMSEATMKALIAAYPELESQITATSDGFVISTKTIMENVMALWAEYDAINNNAAAASMVQILALNNENGAWAANTAEIKKNIAARIAALEAEQLSTHLIGNGYSGTYYGESVGLTGAEANELSMLKGLLKSIDSYGATTTTAGGSSGGGGGSKSTTDAKLDALKSIVSLRKQELSYLEASGATTDEQVAKMREIQSALHDQAEYMRSIGADEEDILKLSTEWWTYQNKITKELKESALALLEVQKEAALGPMQAQLELLKAQKDSVSEQREEEEKLLAVEKARIALENAQNERNVRQYNAKSGQWEWVANAEAVSKAQETLASAEQALSEYYDKKNREQQIAALEASIKDTEATYESLKTAVESNAVLEKMKENSAAWWNADSIVRKALEDQNLALGQSQGWHRINGTWYDAYGNQVYDSGGILRGIGGIKATRDDEMILPPRTTAALLNAEQTGAFDAVIRKLGIVMSAGQAFAGFGGGLAASSIGSQHNGDVYQIGGVTLTEQQARCMTVFDLAQMARNLSLHSA